MPLSGALAIWVSPSADFCRRSADSSLAVAAQAKLTKPVTSNNATYFFIDIDLLGPCRFTKFGKPLARGTHKRTECVAHVEQSNEPFVSVDCALKGHSGQGF